MPLSGAAPSAGTRAARDESPTAVPGRMGGAALSRAPHRTGALARGLADILAYQAGSRAAGRRTETAQALGVADCGKYDRRDDEESARLPRAWVTTARFSACSRNRRSARIARTRSHRLAVV
jgi:hypothetical protein